MTGFPLIIAFVIAIIVMIVAISKFKIHPFLSIMTVSLILGLIAGIPLVNVTAEDGSVTGHCQCYRSRILRHIYQYWYRHYPGRFDRKHPGSDRSGI